MSGLLVGASALHAADEPFWSLKEGLYSESPLLRPGKLDFTYKYRKTDSTYNAFGWGPMFKGGFGVIDGVQPGTTYYAGGFVRPLAPIPKSGDLILGGQMVDRPGRHDYEAQGEYRLPMGLGFGGGMKNAHGDTRYEASADGQDIAFGKLTFRQQAQAWNYILEAQVQDFGGETTPGAYGALYNKELMGVVGTDGEQWRATLGYISSRTNTYLKPAVEALYVDNSIGTWNGVKQVFANATLRWKGGFLSHPVRLGRAMGPQGLEFANPLGFLVPTFNRRLEMWEFGGLASARIEYIHRPDRSVYERYEGLLFPFQFANHRNVLDYVFVGGAYISDSAVATRKDTPSVLGGITGKVGFLNVSAGVEYEFRPSATSVVVGIIDTF